MFLPPLPRRSPQVKGSPVPRSQDASIDLRHENASRSPLQRFWPAKGHHSRISSQIDPKYYYQDSSLNSFISRRRRVEKQLAKYQNLKQTYDIILTDRKRKEDLVREVQTKYDVRFSKREVAASSSAQLALAALSIVNEKQKHAAAAKIERAWRSAQMRKSLAELRLRKKLAAGKIQREWRKHVQRREAKALLARQTKAAVTIQRFWRGHSVRRVTKELLYKLRMQRNFLYFDSIRARLLAESARTIWKYWLAYKVSAK